MDAERDVSGEINDAVTVEQENAYEVAIATAEGAAKVAMEKCEAIAGDAQKACKDSAQATLDLAHANAKALFRKPTDERPTDERIGAGNRLEGSATEGSDPFVAVLSDNDPVHSVVTKILGVPKRACDAQSDPLRDTRRWELGSEFTVRLPLLAQGTRQGVSNDPVVEGDVGRKAKRCILIADDNYDALNTLDMLLKQDGHVVHAARDGEHAFALAAACRPDVALLDIGVPKVDGYRLAQMIRDQEWGKHTLLVAVTGWGQDQDRRRSVEAGFDAHMVKPLDFADLCKRLERVGPRGGDIGRSV